MPNAPRSHFYLFLFDNGNSSKKAIGQKQTGCLFLASDVIQSA